MDINMETKDRCCSFMWNEIVKYVNELNSEKELSPTEKVYNVINIMEGMEAGLMLIDSYMKIRS